MSWLDRFRTSNAPEAAAWKPVDVQHFLFGDDGIVATLALPRVTADTLLKIPAAYDAINVLVRPIKTLPLVFFEREVVRTENGQERVIKKRLSDNAVQAMLKVPNEWQDRVEFLEYMLRNLVTHYNAFAEIVPRGDRAELWPIDPKIVDVVWRNGAVWYVVHEIGAATREIPAVRMWHMKVGPFDAKGLAGIGPILTNQETLQSALAVIEYGGRFFGNDASPSGGYWKHPGKLGLSPEATKTLAKSLRKVFGGVNRHKTTVTEEGLEYVTVNIPNDKAQFIETKKLDAIEIARIWSIPPHKLKALENATFSNIEQQAIEFVVYSLAPWLVAVETSIKTHLIGVDNNIHAEFNVMGLLRGDVKARFESYNIARNGGWFSVDDIRSLENLNPLPDGQGEVYLQPLNMTDTADASTQN